MRAARSTNLHYLWEDLKAERQDPEIAHYRRLEAQPGCDPDEADEADEADEGMLYDRLRDAVAPGAKHGEKWPAMRHIAVLPIR